MEAAAAAAAQEEEEEEYESATSAVDQMPPGFRFNPTDWELIIHYLLKKATNTKFRAVAIGDIDLNKCEPWDLPQMRRKNRGEKELFFFFEKETKYPSGTRTNRATPSGYWKATGKDKEIRKAKMGNIVGMKKTLVFYKGRAPKGEKTNWVIHEYRLHADFSAYNLSPHAKEKWVVCRVFHKNNIQTNPRVDSLVDHFLVDDNDTPTSQLPYSSSPTGNPSSSSAPTHQINPALMLQDSQQHHPPLEINSYNQNQYYSTPYNLNPESDIYSTQMATINSFLPVHEHWYLTSIPIIKGGDEIPNSRILAPHHVYIGGKEPESRMYKTEAISNNNSVISPSQDTGISIENAAADMIDREKESERNKAVGEEEDVCFSPNISELDSLWSY